MINSRKHCHNLHSKTRLSDLARKRRIAERKAQHLKLPDPQQSLIKVQKKVAHRKQVKALRRAIAKREAKKRTKAQQAEADLQEVQLFQNIIK